MSGMSQKIINSYIIGKLIMFRLFLVPCHAALEPEAKGKISNADPVFTDKVWYFVHCGFFAVILIS